MLDLDTRTAILKLHEQKHGTRSIARALGISRGAVKRVIDSGQAQVPRITRDCDAEKHLDRIRQLYAKCKPNLIRVHEELQAQGIELGYSTLTRLCRKHGIGVKPKKASGRYDFGPGEESQHDTSPHDIKVGDKRRRLQCASIVLCFSRCIFAQVYPRFTRFHAKVFLTEALRYFAGTTQRIVVDNTSVLVAHGTGVNAVFAPEVNAWAERFGTRFMAYEKGDKNRNARVERPFWYIETNFYKGRSFEDQRVEKLFRHADRLLRKAPKTSNSHSSAYISTVECELLVFGAFLNSRSACRKVFQHAEGAENSPSLFVIHHSRCNQHHRHHPAPRAYHRQVQRRQRNNWAGALPVGLPHFSEYNTHQNP